MCEVCVVCVQKRTVVVVKTTKSSDEAYCVGCHALLQVLAWSTHACNQTHSRYCKGGGRGFSFGGGGGGGSYPRRSGCVCELVTRPQKTFIRNSTFAKKERVLSWLLLGLPVLACNSFWRACIKKRTDRQQAVVRLSLLMIGDVV